MIRLARVCISGSLTKACWKASLWFGIMQAWWIAISNGQSGPGLGWIKRECLVWPFPYLDSNRLWSHIPVGIASCGGAVQACLLGSSGRWIQVAYGLTQSWRIIHRHKCRTSPLQRLQLASLSLCLHIGIQFWLPCWQKLWVCHFAGVLHQGLPVRHWLVLSWEVMGQNTWGWCHR